MAREVATKTRFELLLTTIYISSGVLTVHLIKSDVLDQLHKYGSLMIFKH